MRSCSQRRQVRSLCVGELVLRLLDGRLAQVNAACTDSITTLRELRAAVPPHLSDEALADTLEELPDARIVFREGNACVGLAMSRAIYEGTAPRVKSKKWVSPYV